MHIGVHDGLENLDFTAETTREKHSHRKRFRQLIHHRSGCTQ
ncbi:hypothetical protein [Kitasatospora sp. NPDC058190]